MTEPRDPGEVDPAGSSPDRESRRGRHWAPGQNDVAASATAAGSAGGDPSGAQSGIESAAPAVPDEADDPDEVEPDPDGPQPDSEPDGPDGPQSGSTADPSAAADAVLASATTSPSSGDAAAAGTADADEERTPVVVAPGTRHGPRHAATGSGFRLQPWMLAVIAVVVIGLLAWLVIGLTTGDDSAQESPSASTTAGEETTSAAPTPVDPVSLPQVLCMGQSYAMLETGQPTEQLLADPATVEAQYPGSKLSTIPPGCIAGSDQRDQVVLALGPFPTLQEACAAGTTTGIPFSAYEGSADTGLKLATCPPA